MFANLGLSRDDGSADPEAVRAVAQMLHAPDLREASFWSEVGD